MPLQIQPDKFYHLRKHLRKKPRTGVILFDSSEVYEFKKESRLKRKDFIKNSPEAKELFKWIFSIRDRLKLTNNQFIVRINKLGGMVSLQTLGLWRRCSGNYPCDRNYKALLILDREASLVTKEIRNVVRETTTGLILK